MNHVRVYQNEPDDCYIKTLIDLGKSYTYPSDMYYQHNLGVLESLIPGDIVGFERRQNPRAYILYTHYAIYTGGEEVIHFGVDMDSSDYFNPKMKCSPCGKYLGKSSIRLDNFWNVAANSAAIKDHPLESVYTSSTPLSTLRKAYSLLGTEGYNFYSWNCEHFVTLCRYDTQISLQVLIFNANLAYRKFAQLEEMVDDGLWVDLRQRRFVQPMTNGNPRNAPIGALPREIPMAAPRRFANNIGLALGRRLARLGITNRRLRLVAYIALPPLFL